MIALDEAETKHAVGILDLSSILMVHLAQNKLVISVSIEYFYTIIFGHCFTTDPGLGHRFMTYPGPFTTYPGHHLFTSVIKLGNIKAYIFQNLKSYF